MKKLVFCLAIVFILTGCSIEKIKNDNDKETIDFSKEYNINYNNRFVKASVLDVLDIFEGGTGIVYLGTPESNFCLEVIKILDEISIEYDVNKIYYLDIEKLKRDNLEDYNKIYKKVKNYLEYKDENNKALLYLPDVYFVKNGKVIGHHISTNKSHDTAVKNSGNWIDLTDYEKSELKNIFVGLLFQLYPCDCK